MKKNVTIQEIFNRLPLEVSPCFAKGQVANYIPALADVPIDKFGISASFLGGEHYAAGDADEKFSIQSISKPFALAFALHTLGDSVWESVGRRVSAKSFNAITPLEEAGGVPSNPFTNAGAIAMIDLLLSHHKNYNNELLQFVRRLSGNEAIGYDSVVADSEKETGHRNAAIAYFLKSSGILKNRVEDVLSSYFQQCSLAMSCNELSRAFLFLAGGGIAPEKQPILSAQQCRRLNALLLMFGAYNGAGDFVFRIGLPGKTGVGGGIAVIIPDKASIVVWSPALDEYGSSVAGLKALEVVTESCGLSIL